jgi:hypothetical protein
MSLALIIDLLVQYITLYLKEKVLQKIDQIFEFYTTS